MKRNYISPLTENIMLTGGSMMDSLTIVTGSGATQITDGQDID